MILSFKLDYVLTPPSSDVDVGANHGDLYHSRCYVTAAHTIVRPRPSGNQCLSFTEAV